MGIEAKATITLTGGSEALKSLQGVTRGTNAASKAAQQAAEETERWQRMAIASHQQRIKEQAQLEKATAKSAAAQAKSAQQAASAKEKAAQAAVTSAQKEAQAIERIQQRQAGRWQRLAQQSASVRMREEAKVTADAQREAAKRIKLAEQTAEAEEKSAKRRRDSLIGGATGAVLAGGATAVNTARSATGHKSVTERVQAANEFRERLVRVASTAGLSTEEREEMQAKILSASAANGQDAGELLGVAESGQAKFNDLRGFLKMVEEVGRISKASGANVERLTDAIGYTNQAFEISGEKAIETGYAIKSSADVGSTEVEALATAFAPVAGTYALTTKQKGEKGRNQFLAMAQTLNTTGVGPEGAATRAMQLLAAVSEKTTQDKLKGIGVRGFVGRDGSIDLSSLIKQLANNRKFQSADTRQKIFDDIRGRQGIEVLMAARQRVQRGGDPNAIDLDNMTPDIAGAKGKVDTLMTDMSSEGFFKAQQENARMQGDTTKNIETFNGQLGFVNEAADKLETAFGSLSVWASSIATTGVGATVGSWVAKGGAPAAAAAEAGGAATGVAGAAAGFGGKALGFLGKIPGAGVLGRVLGPIGAVLTILDLEKRREKFAAELTASREAAEGGAPVAAAGAVESAATGGEGSGSALLEATRAQTRVLQEINSGIRATRPEPAGAPRGPR